MLYSEIVDAIQLENRRKIYDEFSRPGVSRRDSFRNALGLAFDLLTSTPIHRQLNASEYAYLMRKVDPPGLNGLFLSLFYLIIHREDFDVAGFDAAKRLMIEMITEFLVSTT